MLPSAPTLRHVLVIGVDGVRFNLLDPEVTAAASQRSRPRGRPPTPNPALFGTWANTNPNTNSVRDIVITPRVNGIKVDGFGAREPTSCQWGNVPGTVFGANVGSATGKSFEANWNFGFARETSSWPGSPARSTSRSRC